MVLTGPSEDPQSGLPVAYGSCGGLGWAGQTTFFQRKNELQWQYCIISQPATFWALRDSQVMWPREEKGPGAWLGGPVSCLSSVADPSVLLLGLLLLLLSCSLISGMFRPPTGSTRGRPLFLPPSPEPLSDQVSLILPSFI